MVKIGYGRAGAWYERVVQGTAQHDMKVWVMTGVGYGMARKGGSGYGTAWYGSVGQGRGRVDHGRNRVQQGRVGA
jgi:hypothetical protein